jgi:DNA-binding NarL/FixJ family response regulator
MIRVGVAVADRELAERLLTDLSADPGIEVTAEERAADVVIIGHAALSGPAMIGLAQGADVRALLPAEIEPEILGAAIRVVAAGFVITDAHTQADAGENALTARESEVLALLAQGASNKAIARSLAISVHTAKFHVASLLVKLGAHNRSDAVAIGLRRGLILI